MSNPLVSVIIPTYNYGSFITNAVESVLAQTYQEREIIVVDDGSHDETASVLQPYSDLIRYIFQENLGLSAARNTGILAGRGDLIAFLDSDDVWHPRKLEIQVAHLAANPTVGLVASAHREFTAAIPELDLSLEGRGTRFRLLWNDLVKRSRFGPSGVIARRICFDKAGMFDVTLRSAEDRDMWIRISKCCDMDFFDAPLWFYRIHGSSMSRNAKRMEECENQVLQKAFAQGAPIRVKRYSFSFAAYSSSHMYVDLHDYWKSLRCLFKSIWFWPFPYSRSDTKTSLARPKKFVVVAINLVLSTFGKEKPSP